MKFTFKGRTVATIPHRSIRSKGETERMSEDAKALLPRPHPFRNHSGLFSHG